MSHWRLSDWTLGLLAALAVMAAWEGYVLNNRPETRGCGGDFPQFYVAGTIVSRGEAERLYDQPYFRHFQESMRDDPLRSLYPPTMGLLMAPLARLSYDKALAVWWAIQAVCILATRRDLLPHDAAVATLADQHACGLGCAAAAVDRRGHRPLRRCSAGPGRRIDAPQAGKTRLGRAAALDSGPEAATGRRTGAVDALAARPPHAAGPGRGFAFQVLAVAVLLGPGVWLDYLHALPAISAVTPYRYSPLFEQSFAGIASNLLWAAGLAAWEMPAMRIVYAVTAGAAAVMLCRVIWARRPWAGARQAEQGSVLHVESPRNRELRICLRRAVHDGLSALFPRLRPDTLGRAAGHALVVAGLAVGHGPVRHRDRIDRQHLVPDRFQPHGIRGPGGDVFLGDPLGNDARARTPATRLQTLSEITSTSTRLTLLNQGYNAVY